MDEFLNMLERVINSVVETGNPSLILALNVLIIGMVMAYIIWRIKSELRGIKWNQLSFAERRGIIETILSEAIDMSEWLHSNLPNAEPFSKALSKKKRQSAIKYANKELIALGAASQDLRTVGSRMEYVLASRNPSKIRFGASTPTAVMPQHE